MNWNFSGFIWGPTKKYTDEILEYINNRYPVLHYYTYTFNNKTEFSDSVLDIYTTDDIAMEKVKNVKIKNMINHSLSYTYFKFYIDNPNFRKKTNGNTISKVVESLKKQIREEYKSKINNYVYDIIIHITDNHKQTNAIEQIMNKYKKHKKNEFIQLKYFLKCNIKDNVFTRADTLVRKHTISEYLKDKNYDFYIYEKMQKERLGCVSTCRHIKKFKELIHSIQQKGMDDNYPIKCSFNYLLIDGSHRLSYAVLLGKTFIAVQPIKWDNHLDYSIKWFEGKFSNATLDIINKELAELDLIND